MSIRYLIYSFCFYSAYIPIVSIIGTYAILLLIMTLFEFIDWIMSHAGKSFYRIDTDSALGLGLLVCLPLATLFAFATVRIVHRRAIQLLNLQKN